MGKNSCMICMEETEFVLKCKHNYHKNCIKKWLSCKNIYKCPYCSDIIDINILKELGIDIDIEYINNLLETNNRDCIVDMINSYNLEFNEKTFENCVKYCTIYILKILLEKQSGLIFNLSYYAAKYSKFEILKWLYINDYVLNEKTFEAACKSNDILIINYLKDIKCKYDCNGLYYCIKNNNMDMVKWYNENLDCKDNSKIVLEAVKRDNKGIIDWLIDNNYIYNYCDVLCETIKINNIKMMIYFKTKNINYNFTDNELRDLFYSSLESRNLKIIIFIDCNYLNNKNGYYDIDNIINYCIMFNCSIDIIHWLLNRYKCKLSDNNLNTAKENDETQIGRAHV